MSAATGAFSNSTNSSTSTAGQPSDAQQPGLVKAGDGKAPEKTISCVSCRKRKLKCDRIKPKCGTCTRLEHDCEYPERRRNLGSKRRNMKELEARLGRNLWTQNTIIHSLTPVSPGRDPACWGENGDSLAPFDHGGGNGDRLGCAGNGYEFGRPRLY